MPSSRKIKKKNQQITLNIAALLLVAIVLAVFRQQTPTIVATAPASTAPAQTASEPTASGDIILPATWGSFGKQMVDTGVIDQQKFEAQYTSRGSLTDTEKQLLTGTNNGKLVIKEQNSGFILNLLWALGLANKNTILDNGPMNDSKYGGAGNFASTGGWTLAKGDAMQYYSKFPFITLTTEQQALVERTSKNIYRPCCNNPAHFPDCNHGMAMLGLLELMASQGASEHDMYEAAYQVNRLWFPSTYETIDEYAKEKSITISHQDAVGKDYSSGSGFSAIMKQVKNLPQSNSGGCSA